MPSCGARLLRNMAMQIMSMSYRIVVFGFLILGHWPGCYYSTQLAIARYGTGCCVDIFGIKPKAGRVTYISSPVTLPYRAEQAERALSSPGRLYHFFSLSFFYKNDRSKKIQIPSRNRIFELKDKLGQLLASALTRKYSTDKTTNKEFQFCSLLE